ncbi:MAG TPA: hypothetical protein VKQ30_25060 [Ktedonobacterales bacterium]|nr:hypothetical protein [Ktedonobacterales bacterium]
MSFQAKRELVARVGPRYREAKRKQKIQILDEFVAATGYDRKYAIRLLAAPVRPITPIQRPRPRRYGPDYCLQIGGYAYGFEDEQGYPNLRLRPNEIAITRIGERRCLYRFSLDDLHTELLREQLQLRLF